MDAEVDKRAMAGMRLAKRYFELVNNYSFASHELIIQAHQMSFHVAARRSEKLNAVGV